MSPMQTLFPNIDWPEIGQACIDTLLMLGGSLLFTLALGLPLGIWLFVSARGQMHARPKLYSALSLVVNVLRSIPFIILMILLIPLTQAITGVSIGIRGAFVPLVIGAAPFFARLVETALREVDRGVIEASQAMGATTAQIVTRVLLPEARPGLIAATTVTAVALVGYTAMGGIVGAGGLGALAYQYGYNGYKPDYMLVTVALLVVLVQILQSLGDRLVLRYTRR
jgi:D-methionine transport system permease protein